MKVVDWIKQHGLCLFVENEEIRILFLLISALIHYVVFNVFDLTLCRGFEYPLNSLIKS